MRGFNCRACTPRGDDFADRPSESIPLFRDGFDVLTVAVPVPQRAPHGGDVHGQIGFFHDDVGPDALHQGVFGHEMSALLDQHHEQVEGLRGQGYWRTVAGQAALGGVDLEGSKRE